MMKLNTYLRLSAIIFLIVGIAHLARVLTGLDLTVGSTAVPLWMSWIALIVAFILSYLGFTRDGRNY